MLQTIDQAGVHHIKREVSFRKMTGQRKWIPQDIHIVNPPCSSQSLGSFLFKREAWNCMPRLKLEVLRKPLRQIWL